MSWFSPSEFDRGLFFNTSDRSLSAGRAGSKVIFGWAGGLASTELASSRGCVADPDRVRMVRRGGNAVTRDGERFGNGTVVSSCRVALDCRDGLPTGEVTNS